MYLGLLLNSGGFVAKGLGLEGGIAGELVVEGRDGRDMVLEVAEKGDGINSKFELVYRDERFVGCTGSVPQVAAASIPIPAAKPETLTITAAPAVSTRRRKG
nr:hypothetical protein [Tanacetum cinerariifolium]